MEATHSGGMVRRNMACVAPLVNDEVSHYRIPLAPSAACVAFHFLFPVSRHTEFFINVHLPFSKIGCRLRRRCHHDVLYIALANGDVSLCPPISLFQRRHHFWELFFFLARLATAMMTGTAPWHDCLQHHALMFYCEQHAHTNERSHAHSPGQRAQAITSKRKPTAAFT